MGVRVMRAKALNAHMRECIRVCDCSVSYFLSMVCAPFASPLGCIFTSFACARVCRIRLQYKRNTEAFKAEQHAFCDSLKKLFSDLLPFIKASNNKDKHPYFFSFFLVLNGLQI